jgi:hypothetical protein
MTDIAVTSAALKTSSALNGGADAVFEGKFHVSVYCGETVGVSTGEVEEIDSREDD